MMKKHVRVLLCGGLGNQLFQYAFGRAVAERAGSNLTLDSHTMFARDTVYQRTYALDAFCLNDERVVVDGKKVHAERFRRKVSEILSSPLPLSYKSMVVEPTPHRFQDTFQTWVPKRKVTVLGYWQCPAYFDNIADTLKRELAFKFPLPAPLQSTANLLAQSASVAVHVRRKQYTRTLAASCYMEAFRLVREKVPGCRFFVFGDDPDWWTRHDWPDDVAWISGPTHSALDDFRLMSLCKHFVVANSSFSWWAAWLGANSSKKVVAPSPDIWQGAPDCLPHEWIQLPVRAHPETPNLFSPCTI